MNASNTKHVPIERKNYTDDEWGTIYQTKMVLYDAERSLQTQNDLWKMSLTFIDTQATSAHETFRRIKKLKWQRREARVKLRAARSAYTEAVNGPVRRSAAVIEFRGYVAILEANQAMSFRMGMNIEDLFRQVEAASRKQK